MNTFFKSDMVTRKSMHAKRARAESKVIKSVRATVLERDGCRMEQFDGHHCFGRATWAHCEGHRRHQTRGMAPEQRHSDLWTIGLCVYHAQLEEAHTLRTAYLTADMARGPMSFTLRNVVYKEAA